jgi:hypothetical protein
MSVIFLNITLDKKENNRLAYIGVRVKTEFRWKLLEQFK